MKKSHYFLLLILISGCTHPGKKAQKPSIEKDISTDSVITDTSSNYKINKGELKDIIKHHPELITDIASQPDIAYHQQHDINFNSELGQDDYYLLYAYLLKNKNSDIKFRQQRIKLMSIYRAINTIYDRLNNGGTYYSHQESRIPAYVEYSINEGKNNDYYIKTYDIVKQKSLYLNSIKQLITDELDNNADIPQTEKSQLKNKLFETVNGMNGLITNTFYLKMAQQFQYSNY